MAEPRLLLTCGLPGAGKTTGAVRLAADRPAVRLSKDEWQWELGSTPWDRDLGQRLERQLVGLAAELLERGVSVVLDFGLWARDERDELREMARAAGVGVELHLFDAPIEELWRRVELRNQSAPWNRAPIAWSDLSEWSEVFERPDDDELALFDTPPS